LIGCTRCCAASQSALQILQLRALELLLAHAYFRFPGEADVDRLSLLADFVMKVVGEPGTARQDES
jgi:hypothetical protein